MKFGLLLVVLSNPLLVATAVTALTAQRRGVSFGPDSFFEVHHRPAFSPPFVYRF